MRCGQGWRCLLCNTDVLCYFSVAMKIVYGKLGAIRVVTSQLGFARPFSIRFFLRGMLYQLSYVLIPWIRMPAIPHGWFSILSFKGMIFATMLPDGILFSANIKKYGYLSHKNHFLTSFRLEVFFSCLWVDVKELMGSLFLGKWLCLCIHLMYESHMRNSIGCGYLSPCQILWVKYLWLA